MSSKRRETGSRICFTISYSRIYLEDESASFETFSSLVEREVISRAR